MEDEGRKEGWKEMKQAGRRAPWWRQWALLGAALALAVSPMGGAVALAEAETIFQQLPARFTLTSGIGGWQCILQIEADGAFTGRYWDEDSGDCAAEYPRGTVYLCGFSGQFAEPEMTGPYSCTMKLARLETAGRPGACYLREGTRWVYVQPWGFEEAETFMLYLPGAEMAGVPQGFLEGSFLSPALETMPEGVYGLYNPAGERAFMGYGEEGAGEAALAASAG